MSKITIPALNYTVTDWTSNTTISPTRLNKIEQGLKRTGEILESITNAFSMLETAIEQINNNIQGQYENLKKEINGKIDNQISELSIIVAQRYEDINQALQEVRDAGIAAGTAAADEFLDTKGVWLDGITNDIGNLKGWKTQTERTIVLFGEQNNEINTRIDGLDNNLAAVSDVATTAREKAEQSEQKSASMAQKIDNQLWLSTSMLNDGLKTEINKQLSTAFGVNNDSGEVDSADLKNVLDNFLKTTLLDSNGLSVENGADSHSLLTEIQNLRSAIAAVNNKADTIADAIADAGTAGGNIIIDEELWNQYKDSVTNVSGAITITPVVTNKPR